MQRILRNLPRASTTVAARQHLCHSLGNPSVPLHERAITSAHLRGFSSSDGNKKSKQTTPDEAETAKAREKKVEEERKRLRQKIEESKRSGDVVGLARAMTALGSLGAATAIAPAAFLPFEAKEVATEDDPGMIMGEDADDEDDDEDEFWSDDDDESDADEDDDEEDEFWSEGDDESDAEEDAKSRRQS